MRWTVRRCGLSRQAVVPYGWQPLVVSPAFVPTTPSGNLTTLVFVSRDNRLRAFTCPGAATAELVVACFERTPRGSLPRAWSSPRWWFSTTPPSTAASSF